MPQTEAILERILRLTDRVIENRDEIGKIKLDIAELKHASKINSENSTISIITTFLKEVMPVQWWAIVVFLLLASVLGIVSPKEILAQLKSGHQEVNGRTE